MSSILNYRAPQSTPSDNGKQIAKYNSSRVTHASANSPDKKRPRSHPHPPIPNPHPPVFYSNVGAAFLASLRVALKQCFGSMHRAVVKKGGSVDVGLNKIHAICVDEAAHIQKQFPAILLQYRLLMLQFAKTQFSDTIRAAHNGAFQNKQLTIAPFPMFIKTLLENISESEEMRSSVYFTSMTFSEQNIFFKDMVLVTISQSTTMQTKNQITPSDSPSSAPVKYIYGAPNPEQKRPTPPLHGSSLLY